MTGTGVFAVVVLLLAGAFAVDIWFGSSMKRRGLLQAVIVFLLVAMWLTVPSCRYGGEDREGPDIPYSF